MKLFHGSLQLALILCLTQLFSCQKNIDKSRDTLHVETSSDAGLTNEYIDCKLRTIVHEHGGISGKLVTGTFVYHADGLPYSLTYGSGTGTGNPNFYFLYDTKRRLREYREGYSVNDIVEATWHKYGYNTADQIVVDTIYNPGVPSEGMPGDTSVSLITYDPQGRVIKEVITKKKTGASQTITYAYDSRGNLVVNGWPSSSYDYSISIFRANPVFSFIHRNYSKNNAAAQAQYNVKGLPLSNNPMNDGFFNAYPNNIGGKGISKASYDCDAPTPANEFVNCKLRTITHENGGVKEWTTTGTFVYHPDGLPASLTHGSQTGTGNPNYYFFYDSKRRLREFRVGYSPTDPVEAVFSRYGYNSNNQIVQDTFFNASGYSPEGEVLFAPRFISTITYDAKGRITGEVVKESNGNSSTRSYQYDSRGNLVVPGWSSTSYDNKVSIFRSHPLFQFIHRNYSVNNAAVQPQYNSKGLPLSLRPSNDPFFGAYQSNPGGGFIGGISKATYDCQ